MNNPLLIALPIQDKDLRTVGFNIGAFGQPINHVPHLLLQEIRDRHFHSHSGASFIVKHKRLSALINNSAIPFIA